MYIIYIYIWGVPGFRKWKNSKWMVYKFIRDNPIWGYPYFRTPPYIHRHVYNTSIWMTFCGNTEHPFKKTLMCKYYFKWPRVDAHAFMYVYIYIYISMCIYIYTFVSMLLFYIMSKTRVPGWYFWNTLTSNGTKFRTDAQSLWNCKAPVLTHSAWASHCTTKSHIWPLYGGFLQYGCPQIVQINPLEYHNPWFWGSTINKKPTNFYIL